MIARAFVRTLFVDKVTKLISFATEVCEGLKLLQYGDLRKAYVAMCVIMVSNIRYEVNNEIMLKKDQLRKQTCMCSHSQG